MRFVVPQFIDIEPKIMGPVSLRQFLILLATGGLIFVCYKLADFTLFLIETVVLFALGGIIAFFKVNGQPVHFFLLNFLQSAKRPKLRVWYKEGIEAKEVILSEKVKEKEEEIARPPLSSKRLSEISLIVDTGGAYREEM